MTAISLLVHGEFLPDARKIAWWAESPDVPGFSAAADTLVELRELATETIRDIWTDKNEDPETIELRWELLPPEPETEGPRVAEKGEQKTAGPPVVEFLAPAAAA
jgi:predicted RNase H-like HicB family nuclease